MEAGPVRAARAILSPVRAVARSGWGAASVGTAALVGVLASCVHGPSGTTSHDLPAPSEQERYCAWFGSRDGDVLYFGMSPFWSASAAAGGEPTADLAHAGPQQIGRYDLRRERMLPPLEVSPAGSNGGLWDVLARDGRVWFTDYFGASGYVTLATGEVVRLPALGPSLNEIAPGPDGDVLITRYAEQGSVLRVAPDGELRAEHALLGIDGVHVTAKSVAWDPVRREIWVNTDLIPVPGEEGEITYDVRVLDESGAERLRFALPEVQFMAFGPDGTGWFAEVDGALLSLRVRPPERAAHALLTGRRVPLDDAFPAGSDFVQEIVPTRDGGAVVMRWSGRAHLVSAEGEITALSLPREPGDLYYTGVRRKDRLCATRCGDVSVVCTDASPPGSPD